MTKEEKLLEIAEDFKLFCLKHKLKRSFMEVTLNLVHRDECESYEQYGSINRASLRFVKKESEFENTGTVTITGESVSVL